MGGGGGGGGGAGGVDVCFCALFEREAAVFESADDLPPRPSGDEDVVGEVGRDEEDGSGCCCLSDWWDEQ